MNSVNPTGRSIGFSAERNGLVYGFVRGTSMWPAFIAGDVLRAERIPVTKVLEGDVVVLDREALPPLVHRVVSVQPSADGLLLWTAGDRSGSDPPVEVPGKAELLRVVGVLRKGRWRQIAPRFPFARLLPGILVRLHCRLVRRLLWPVRGVDRLPSDEQ